MIIKELRKKKGRKNKGRPKRLKNRRKIRNRRRGRKMRTANRIKMKDKMVVNRIITQPIRNWHLKLAIISHGHIGT